MLQTKQLQLTRPPDRPVPQRPARSCTGVLLAAGSSQRFGSDKRLHLLANSEPLALTTLGVWADALTNQWLSELIVVTRGDPAHPDPLDALVLAHAQATGITIRVVNAPKAELGMGHSLAAAIPHTPRGPIIVGLADMPYLQGATIQQIARALQLAAPSAIVRPSYKGTPGNPVGFGAQWHQTLGTSSGDQGARTFVQEAARNRQLTDLPVTDGGILRDIDTQADLVGQTI